MNRRVSCLLISCAMLLINCRELWAVAVELAGRVIDENGLVVAGASISLAVPDTAAKYEASSDSAGRFRVSAVPPGVYLLRAEKVGFYAFVSSQFVVSENMRALEVVLNHRREFDETVNVEYSAPTIDHTETASQTTLTQEDIVDLPYPASHDFRNALPMIPGVIKDNRGRIHMNGGGENQAFYSLDGFNITSPVSGILENRISVDAIRAIRVEGSRFSAEFGKGSAGSMALETPRGDDRFRFSATNFVPSFENHDGLNISNWNPRATFSGPIVKGRAWYFNALDLQYDLNIVDTLPSNANKSTNWTGSDMTLFQVNLTSRNILSLGFLINLRASDHLGITALDPLETTRNRHESFYFFSVRDQAYFAGGWVLETGVALNHLGTTDRPLGNATYTIRPQGRSGNYYMLSEGSIERLQGLATLLSPYWNWHGRHSFKIGVDGNDISYHQLSLRRTIDIRRWHGSLARRVTYTGNPSFQRENSEFSFFGQDRWSPREWLLVECGLRMDWDQILRDPLWSPRLAATISPHSLPGTKLSVGIGLYYDATNLDVLTRELDQQRLDTFYADDGVTITRGPILSSYVADEQHLKAPRYLNRSLQWEQKLPHEFYLRTSFIRKDGHHGWAYDFVPHPLSGGLEGGTFLLRSQRTDRYTDLEVTVGRLFQNKYPCLLSYTRSSAHSSAVIDFSLENTVFGHQAGGPVDWDAPNRIISWGTLPVPRLQKYLLAYFLEWHSGFPYSTVDDSQTLYGAPNSRRYPNYFSLNLHCERRFTFWRTQWALRGGFNNITGDRNPMVVMNTINSPGYGQFSGGQGRVFTGRIRFLGRS